MVQLRKLIAIPACNEEKTIVDIIRRLRNFTEEEIIVFDDASTDNTRASSEALNVKVYTSEKNYGYEQTINRAYIYACNHGFDCIVFIDADGEHDPKYIVPFLSEVENYLVVSGQRSNYNRIGERLAGCICGIFFDVWDPYCGMKGYNLLNLKKLTLQFAPGNQIGFGLMFEIIRKFGRHSASIININGISRADLSRFSTSTFKTNISLVMNVIFLLVKSKNK